LDYFFGQISTNNNRIKKENNKKMKVGLSQGGKRLPPRNVVWQIHSIFQSARGQRRGKDKGGIPERAAHHRGSQTGAAQAEAD
jgi:hypothetical protein